MENGGLRAAARTRAAPVIQNELASIPQTKNPEEEEEEQLLGVFPLRLGCGNKRSLCLQRTDEGGGKGASPKHTWLCAVITVSPTRWSGGEKAKKKKRGETDGNGRLRCYLGEL